MSQTGLQLGFELGLTLKRGMVFNWPGHFLQMLRWWSSPLQQHHSRHPESKTVQVSLWKKTAEERIKR